MILKALLKPLAKNPPNGAMMEANSPSHKACHCTGKTAISFHVIYKMFPNEKLSLKIQKMTGNTESYDSNLSTHAFHMVLFCV